MAGCLARCPQSGREAARGRIFMFVLQLERACFFWIIRGVPFDPGITLTALTDSLDTALHPRRRGPAGS
jgi:hypothetical protein